MLHRFLYISYFPTLKFANASNQNNFQLCPLKANKQKTIFLLFKTSHFTVKCFFV